MEGYQALQYLNYGAAKSQRQKARSVSAEIEEKEKDGSALDTDASLLGGNFAEWFKACLIFACFHSDLSYRGRGSD
jgi:hypothetical protein